MIDKMTAVEWLMVEIFKQKLNPHYENLLEQAKEMEKQHIEDAFYQRDLDEFGDEVEFEQYYNETFKSE